MDALLPILFVAALVLNVRASFKLGLDWKRHADDGALRPRRLRAPLARCRPRRRSSTSPQAPVFLHLVPAFQEPDIAGTVKALLRLALPARRACTSSS